MAATSALTGSLSRSISVVVAAWRGITWKHVLYTALLCLGWGVIDVASITSFFTRIRGWGPPVNGMLSAQFNGFAVMLSVLVADRVSPAPLRRWWPYVVALLVGVASGSTLYWLFSQYLFTIPTPYQVPGGHEAFATFALRHGVYSLVICGLATYIYASGRYTADSLAALRAMQLDRFEREKRVLESRLAAMQARIEPKFLLETLSRVERLYEIDAHGADVLLTELSVYLRAAIPQTDDPGSTVAREIRLTNALLNIAGRQSRNRLVVRDAAAPLDESTRMPPMVLLPLINYALTHRTQRAKDDESFGIHVARCNGMLRLTIHDRDTGFAESSGSEPRLAEIRGRLAALYGEKGRLTLGDVADGSEAVLEIPYEVVRRNAPA